MKKTTVKTFRVSDHEDKLLKAKARTSQMSQSKYCRTCALDKEIIVIEGLGKLIPELNKIGSNINHPEV
ncbi:MAG: hypothetical protein R3Y63_11695 [Eubacteriales bacterium]